MLTKVDKLAAYGATQLPFNLDFYAEVHDLERLLPHLAAESRAAAKFESLNRAIIGLVEDFGLVSFELLAVEDKKSMMTLLHAVDRAGGYAFGAEGANDSVWQVAMREGFRGMEARDVQERWVDRKEEFDELEARENEARAKEMQTEDLYYDDNDIEGG